MAIARLWTNPLTERLRAVLPASYEGAWLQAVVFNSADRTVEIVDTDVGGGRFNPPGRCPTLYLAQDTPECRARMTPWCGKLSDCLERVILVYQVRFARLVNLCDPRTIRELGFTRAEILGADLSVPRSIGIAAYREEFEGILYPRPAARGGINLCLFRLKVAVDGISVLGRLP